MRAHALNLSWTRAAWSRAVWFRLLLVALLVFAQQAAMAHAVAHPFEVGSFKQGEGKGKSLEPLCEQCLAHAQLAGVTGAEVAPRVAALPHDPAFSAPHAARHARFLRPFDSRGPPRS